MSHKVADLQLAEQGRLRIEWAESRMPVLMKLREQAWTERPLAGMRVASCLHVTKEAAVLIRTLRAAGAEVSWAAASPSSTSDEVAAALAAEGTSIYAWHGLSPEERSWCIGKALEVQPTLTLDHGADLTVRVHQAALGAAVIGGTEETTTGVHRLRARAADGKLEFPVYAINDSETKWDFDNAATGQSSLDGILRATSVFLAGKTFVVAGYGHCGRRIAARARGMGAQVVVTEVVPTTALKAVLDGFRVMTMDEASAIGDIFITATGVRDIVRGRHFERMKDGAIISNTGHYDVEINITELDQLAKGKREVRPNNEEYTLADGRRVYLLAQGRVLNVAAAEGHPSEVLDMSFGNQYLALCKLMRDGGKLDKKVHQLPRELDQQLAAIKLATIGIAIDQLTDEQKRFAADYAADS